MLLFIILWIVYIYLYSAGENLRLSITRNMFYVTKTSIIEFIHSSPTVKVFGHSRYFWVRVEEHGLIYLQFKCNYVDERTWILQFLFFQEVLHLGRIIYLMFTTKNKRFISKYWIDNILFFSVFSMCWKIFKRFRTN